MGLAQKNGHTIDINLINPTQSQAASMVQGAIDPRYMQQSSNVPMPNSPSQYAMPLDRAGSRQLERSFNQPMQRPMAQPPVPLPQPKPMQGYADQSTGVVGEPDFRRGGGCFAAGGPTYGLSSIPQVASAAPQSPMPSGVMSSPYVSNANPMSSPAVAAINGNGIPQVQSSYAPVVTPNSATAGSTTPAATTAPTPAASTPLKTLTTAQLNQIPGQVYAQNAIQRPLNFNNLNFNQQQQLLRYYNSNLNNPTSQVTPLTGSMPKKNGGEVDKLAAGGIPTSEALSPWYTRADERGMIQPEGLVMGTAGGRTDVHNVFLPSGSYVVPADVASGLGEGNSLSGASVMDRVMHSNPYGIQGSAHRGSMIPPRAPAPFKENRGGKVKDHGSLVPVVIAAGEMIYHPQTIIKKFGSLEKGHSALDRFVVNTRKSVAKAMLRLPGPKGMKK